ncbi:MAG: hypothetical protein QW476_04565 [Candidatus Bathyarchaeia archaeon]|nr:hypothetical protein [Candidatus Bathyarchaeota archaeon]
MKVNIYITQVSGERFWKVNESFPSQIQISVNINMLGFEQKTNELIEAPFIFSINFAPPIAHITLKGVGQVSGDKNDIEKVLENYKEKKPPPIELIQAISGVSMAEAIVVSKIIGIPPPLPPFIHSQPKPKESPEVRYTS